MRVFTEARLLEIHYLEEDVLNSYSDVQIISAEGEIVSTNRLALASCSGLLHQLFAEIEQSGSLGSESDLVISTNVSVESLNVIVDFVTRGILPVGHGSNKNVTKIDPLVIKDLLAFGVDLSSLELEVVESDTKEEQQKRVLKKRNEQVGSDQSRFVKLDWDILGAALESIGGLDPNNTTSVQVVSAEGESQQIIIQPGDSASSFLAQLGGDDTFLEATTHVTTSEEQTITRKRHLEEMVGTSSGYIAASAKMRRILKTSKMSPHKRRIEMEASFGISGKPRGRPRKVGISSPEDERKSRGRLARSEVKIEDEKENSAYKREILERPGRRPVKKPRRYDGEDEADTEDPMGVELIEGEEFIVVAEGSGELDGQDFVAAKLKRKRRIPAPKVKRLRGPASVIAARNQRANETPVRWITCVACGKICKSNYLFKVHQKNFGPYHNNSCALCHEEFLTWEGHIAHLREKHNGEYKYKCGICPEVFETEERQRIHRHEIHTRKNKDKTACDKCGKVVIDYAAHQENYHGTEEHPCQHCPRVFGHTMALKRHIKDNHRQFPCEHCGNIMKNFKKYRLHILSVHTPDNLKPYQCQVCVPARGFPTKWNLFEHMNKHTNDRPFKCRNCPASFATTSSRCHHEKACSGNKGLRVLK